MRLAAVESVPALEASAARPRLARRGGVRLVFRREVPLADRNGQVATVGEDLRGEPVLARDAAVVTGVADGEVDDATDPVRVVVPAGEQARRASVSRARSCGSWRTGCRRRRARRCSGSRCRSRSTRAARTRRRRGRSARCSARRAGLPAPAATTASTPARTARRRPGTLRHRAQSALRSARATLRWVRGPTVRFSACASAWAAEEAAGERAGVLAVFEGHGPGLHRVPVARGLLHEAPATGGEVVDEVRSPTAEGVEVDDVDVGDVPGRDHAAVEPTDVAGGPLGLPVHELLDGQPLRRACGRAPRRRVTRWSCSRRRSHRSARRRRRARRARTAWRSSRQMSSKLPCAKLNSGM